MYLANFRIAYIFPCFISVHSTAPCMFVSLPLLSFLAYISALLFNYLCHLGLVPYTPGVLVLTSQFCYLTSWVTLEKSIIFPEFLFPWANYL